MNGSAVRPTSDPKMEIVSPVQSLTKLGLRQSGGGRVQFFSCSTVPLFNCSIVPTFRVGGR